MKYLILCLLLTGCGVDRLAHRSLYPFELVNKNSESAELVGQYPNTEGPVIFYLHGNGESLSDLEKGFTKAMGLFGYLTIPEYPGLGLVPGVPDQKTIMDKVRKDFADAKKDWSGTGRKIYIVGRSLGAAVAAQLSTDGADGLLLISPWTSAKAAGEASKMGFLVRFVGSSFWKANEWNTIDAVSGFKNKRLVIHGKSDELIPFSHGQSVAEKMGTVLKEIDSGHNDIYSKIETWETIREFLR